MFESIVYMSWILMLFAFVFFFFWRKNIVLSAGALISALVTLYGHLLPIDSNLEVLVPVLRSNYWLTIHVMTIVSSYGAFGLATALGHRHLFFAMRNTLRVQEAEESAHFIDRIMQLGVMLLGIGTVLGGVWANESWGRFWGWDPKETWALITFLAYLAVIHLRYTNKLNDFWTAFCAVLGFFFVLMTWYGVNFVLGRGLHSYGFGSGGSGWIVGYVVLESLFLLAAAGYAANKKRS
jgi:cytochrome c-type biogenesis protein CcsB